jgi:predicted methyltransferase
MSASHARFWITALVAALGVAAGTACAADATSAPAPAPYVVPANAPAYIKAAIADPARPADARARDANRKPAELLMMSGIKPGQTVVEFASFGQYFTTFLSDIVGPKGKVYMYDLPYTEKRAGDASRAFVAAHPNSQYQLVDYNTLELPQNVDEVFMVLYYHDLSIQKIDTSVLNARIFKALKPGGIFFVVDHNAAPGSGRRDTEKLHRIDPALIRSEVTAAGFKLVQESNLLAASTDDHSKLVFAPGLRGVTDQSVFVFQKPAK